MIRPNWLDQGDVKRWRDEFSVPPGVLETVSHWVGFDRTMVVLDLLWPAFIEVRGCVLLPWEFQQDAFDVWWSKLEGDPSQVEETLNHLHLWDVFDPDQVHPDGISHLGATMAKTWRAALQEQFPNRRFYVSLTETIEDYGPTIRIHT